MKFGKSHVLMLNGSSDEQKLRELSVLAGNTRKGSFRRKVCFQVSSQQLLRQLQTQECGDGIAERFEVHPFSFEELWAQRLFVSLPRRRSVASPLDWHPVTWSGGRRVSLVIFGMNSMTEALVRHACLVCHYPNYVRDSNLKTCITIVDPALKEDDNLLVRRYGTLMANCRWSFVDRLGCASVHEPECGYLGGEYVDVEFRLMAVEPASVVARVMLADLSRSKNDLPTIVFAGEDGEVNWDLATGLPTEYYVEGCDIPVYARMKNSAMLGSATMMPQYRNIRAFGMDDCEYDLSLPLTQMAIGVSYLYNHCAETGQVVCDNVDRRRALTLWNQEKTLNRFSCEANAMTIMTKLRSVGKVDGVPLTDEEVALLSEVEHNRWSVERLMAGVRPVTPDEQREIDNDRSLKKRIRDRGAHYDLRPYGALKEDFAGRNVQLYDEALVRGLGAVVRAFEKGDTGALPIIVKREQEDKKQRWKKPLRWFAALVGGLLLLGIVGYMLINQNLKPLAERMVGEYVYKLRIDSIEVWHGNEGVDTVLRSARNQDVGTAFSVEGVGIVTARHCVEYWLYDCLSALNDSSKWSPEVSLAVEVESFNDTTHGEPKRMVAVCSLFDNQGRLKMDRVVFDVDRQWDKVRRIGTSGKRWRYVVPLFKGDRDMLKSDVAVVRRSDERGIRLRENSNDLSGNVCILGYPKNGSGVRSLICRKKEIDRSDETAVWLSDKASKGMSGGPVVKWHLWGFDVVGVMSRNDEAGGESSWATTINAVTLCK